MWILLMENKCLFNFQIVAMHWVHHMVILSLPPSLSFPLSLSLSPSLSLSLSLWLQD